MEACCLVSAADPQWLLISVLTQTYLYILQAIKIEVIPNKNNINEHSNKVSHSKHIHSYMKFQVFMPVDIQITHFLNILSYRLYMDNFSEEPDVSISRAEDEESSFLQNTGIYLPATCRHIQE
jgi:hypothetical protein